MFEHMDAVPDELRPARQRLALVAAITLLADRERERSLEPDSAGSTATDLFVVQLIDLVHAMVGTAPSPALAAALARAEGSG